MRFRIITITCLSILILSCGKTKEEIKLEQLQTEHNKEIERIHLEKIEVGKSKMKMELTKELERLNKIMEQENKKLDEINEFKLGRSSSTKDKELSEQNKRIYFLETVISKIENEISELNLTQTYDFQDSPKQLVNYLFEMAQNKDFSKMRHLCDPYGEGDNESRSLCLLEIHEAGSQQRYIETFQNGRIIGNPILEDNEAIVEIATGPNSDRLIKINLINRMGKWYVYSL
ncbi:hypothetical protein M0G43_07795 [Subsaxibacter sp. CAU 1640]|uniref:hypothetical protein n=1 Tax=Subsaxibacter sp. CAU 1640 TaxID=2933271 RepID=UPI002003ABD1|nr:hypothetical protein [Subsaxibacter sp. CAU 1640]MCK7590469.1 hypothetical protein [Subsaxibacter sp. CAU 1640]